MDCQIGCLRNLGVPPGPRGDAERSRTSCDPSWPKAILENQVTDVKMVVKIEHCFNSMLIESVYDKK